MCSLVDAQMINHMNQMKSCETKTISWPVTFYSYLALGGCSFWTPVKVLYNYIFCKKFFFFFILFSFYRKKILQLKVFAHGVRKFCLRFFIYVILKIHHAQKPSTLSPMRINYSVVKKKCKTIQNGVLKQ